MQTTEDNTEKWPRRNRKRRGKNIDKSSQSEPQTTMRYGADVVKGGLAPPIAPQSQTQSFSHAQSQGRRLGLGNEIDPSSTSSAQPTATQSQAQTQSQLKISASRPQPSSVGNPTSVPEAPASPPARVPSPPPFSSVKFTKIGQQPELLKRISDFASGVDIGVEHESQASDRSGSPEPTVDVSGPVSWNAPALRLGRRSLLQSLGGSGINADANTAVDPTPSGVNSITTTDSGAAIDSGNGVQSQSAVRTQSQPTRAQYSSTGDRSARSLSQSRRSSTGNSIGASNINSNINSNSNLTSNGNQTGNTNATPQQTSSTPTPDLLYPNPSISTFVAPENHSNSPRAQTGCLTSTSPVSVSGDCGGANGNGTGSTPMSNLLALRNLLEAKTASLKARAAHERERDATNDRERDSGNNAGSGSQPRASSFGQGTHIEGQRSPPDMHSESNAHAEPGFDTKSSQRNATVSPFRQVENPRRNAQSPTTHLDAPSQTRLPAGQAHTEMLPSSHASPAPSSNSNSAPASNIIASDNVASTSSAPDSPSFHANTHSQIPRDALDSALSSAKQWIDDMSRARSEIQALLARATIAESAAQSLRSELALSRSESVSLHEQVSSSSALLSRVQIEAAQLQEQVGTLKAEIEGLRAREEEERRERELVREEVEEAVKVGEGIMELVDGWVVERRGGEGRRQEQEQEVEKEKSERTAHAAAETESQARLEKEQEEQSRLETQLQLQREQEEADAASFAKKRAEVMKEKERANQENAERIRAAREGRSIAGGVKLSTSSTTAASAALVDSRNYRGSDVNMPEEDVPAVPVLAPSSAQALPAASSTSPESQRLFTPPSPCTSQNPSKSSASPSVPTIFRNVGHRRQDLSALSSSGAGGSEEFLLGPVQVSYATQVSNLRHLRGVRLTATATSADAGVGLKKAHVEIENEEADGKMHLQLKHGKEEDVDVKMEDEDTAPLASSHADITESHSRSEPSPPSTVQMQVASEISIPSSRRSSSYNERVSQNSHSGESLPRRPSSSLPPDIPTYGPAAHKATPMSAQTSLSSGPPSAPKFKLPNFTKIKNIALDDSSEKFVDRSTRDPQQHQVSDSRFQPTSVSAPAALDDDGGWQGVHARPQTPEPVINFPLTSAQVYERNPSRPYPSSPRNQTRRQMDQYPRSTRQLTPPAMPYRRPSDYYPPPSSSVNILSCAQHYSPPPAPPSPGPSARTSWSRKRPRSTADSYVSEEEPPTRRPRQEEAGRERVIYERPPAAESRFDYVHADEEVPDGPRTPPRPAPWDLTPEPEPHPQYKSRYQPRSPSPPFRDGRTVRIGHGESYRPAYDLHPQRFYDASPPRNERPDGPERQQWEYQNAAHVPETYDPNAGPSVSGALSSRMDIHNPVSIEPIQRHPSPQHGSANLTLLDRMSDNQRPLPSGPSSQSHSRFQSSGNNNHDRRTSNSTRGGGQRGQFRGRQARGRGGGRRGAAEFSNLEHQTLAARISGSSTLQDRLS